MLPVHRPCRVFLVEDDPLVAEAIADALMAAQLVLAGWATDQVSAMAWLDDADLCPDVALLDIGLPGGVVYPVAARLRERHVAMVFTTGTDPASIPEPYKDIPVLEKPFGFRELRATLSVLDGQLSLRTTPSPRFLP